MSTSATDHIEVHWRVTGSNTAWSVPKAFALSDEIVVDGLKPNTGYDFEARGVSACGAKSVWVPSGYTTPPVPADNVTLLEVQTQVAQSQADANAANAELANIANDNILSPAEKPTVMRDYSVITTEQAGIDAQATQYGVTTQRSDYDNAISTLTAYLNTLNTPVAWNNKNGDTTITGTTFRGYFNSVYTTRQALLNAIYQVAKGLADSAQGTADTANTTANTANANTPLVTNPNFVDGLNGWRVEPGVTGWGAQNALASSPNPQIPTYVSYYAGSAANTALRNKSCNPCQAGDVVSATCQVACASGGGSGYIRIIFYNSASQELAGGGTGNSFTGNGTGTSRATATAPAGSVYFVVAPAIVGYTTGVFRFTAFAVSLGARSLDEVPDGTTYGRTATNYLSNNRAIVDFNDTFHRNKTQDYIPAGATWGATRLSALQNGVPQWATSGKNLAPNASFASNKVGTPAGNLASGAPISDGWAVSANPAGFYVAYEQNAGGVSDVEIQLNGGTVVPANGSVTAFVQTVSPVPVKAGAPYAVTGTRGCQSNVALPAGITVASRIYAQFLFADGSSAGYSPLNEIDGNAYAPTAQTVVGTVPANAVSAIIGLQMYVTNGTASAITVGASGQIPAGIRWYNAQFVESVNLDYEAVDGTTHGRIAMQDVFQVSGVNRSGLRVPGSGYTVGDQRNLLPVTWAGVRSVNSTSPITYTYTWNAAAGLYNISVNVAAYTLYGGDFSLNYAASSLSGTQAASTTVSAYYYYLDPTSSGGSLALHYATDPAVLAQQNGVVFIGSASLTTPAPASAPGGGAGGGGGGFCVADDMFIGDGRLAGDADIGDPFDCIDLPTAAGKHVRALQGFTRGVEECVRMITSDGCALVCSVSTPFDLPDGRSTTAPHMLGEQVITDLGTATVVSLALVGPKPVTRAHLGGVSYAAGADPQRRIYSHNAGTSKP